MSRAVAMSGIVGVLVGAAVAFDAGRRAAANVFASRDPARALRFDSTNAKALAATLDAKLIAGNWQMESQDVERVRAALVRTPLSAPLLRLLGFSRDITGDTAGARRFMSLADSVSRRDVLTQIWLIEDAVHRESVDEALRHYDVALTVSPETQELLFPVLSGALSEPQIRARVAAYVVQRRPWTEAFLAYAIANSAPNDVAAVMARAGTDRDARFRALRSELLRRFQNEGDVAGALAFASRMDGGRPDRFTIFDFNPRTVASDFQPLTWQLSTGGEIDATLDSNNHLQIVAAPGASGSAATRTMVLRAGRWQLAYAVAFPNSPSPAQVRWEWQCLTGKSRRLLWESDVPASSGGGQSHRSIIEVPQTCTAVEISLLVRAAEGSEDGEVTIQRAELTPLAAAPS